MSSLLSANARRICAIVPAAGRGTRLMAEMPKIFVPILPNLMIWDVLRSKLSKISTSIVLILSPEGLLYQKNNPDFFNSESFNHTKIAIQSSPLGMGDAIFSAVDLWRDFDDVLIVWGDQINLSVSTVEACVKLHLNSEKPALTFPLIRMPQGYVEYIFDSYKNLTDIKQSREGDTCKSNGLSDVGVFLLTGGSTLIEAWTHYRKTSACGLVTGEINFLPFLVYLSACKWKINQYETTDLNEVIGINNQEDLAKASQILKEKKSIYE